MKRIPLRLALGLLVVLSPPAWAQTKTGTTIGQFLLIEPSARVAGMGNAGAASSGGLQSVYYNPGAIGLLEGWDVEFSHAVWYAGIQHEHVALGVPLGKWGQGALSLTSLNSGDMDVRTVSQPLGTGERFSVSDVAVGIGYGKRITDRFAAGAVVHWLQESIWHSAASTMVASFGTMYEVSDHGLHLGASLSNFGTQGRFDGRDLRILYDSDPTRYGDNGTLPGLRFTDPFSLPVLFRVGLAQPWSLGGRRQLLFAVDAEHPSDNSESMNLGVEYDHQGKVALRTGWQNLFQQDSETGFTVGLGIRTEWNDRPFAFDYAWASHERLDGTHRMTLGVHF